MTKQPKTNYISLRVTNLQYKKLRKASHSLGIKRSVVIRMALDKFLQDNDIQAK